MVPVEPASAIIWEGMTVSPGGCTQERRQGTVMGEPAQPEILEIQFGDEDCAECDAAKDGGEDDCEDGLDNSRPFYDSRGFAQRH